MCTYPTWSHPAPPWSVGWGHSRPITVAVRPDNDGAGGGAGAAGAVVKVAAVVRWDHRLRPAMLMDMTRME